MRGTLDAAKRAIPHLNTYKVASTIADAAKKRKKVDITAKHSQRPQLKKAGQATSLLGFARYSPTDTNANAATANSEFNTRQVCQSKL